MRRRLVTSLHPFRFTLIGLLTLAFAAGSIPMAAVAGIAPVRSDYLEIPETNPQIADPVDYLFSVPPPPTDPCPSDSVPLHGHVHIVTRHRDKDDSTSALVGSTEPVIEVYVNPVDLMGVGSTTGDLYVVGGAIKVSFQPPPDSDRTFGFVGFLELMSSACVPRHLPFSFTLTYDANWVLDVSLSSVTVVRPHE